MGFFCYSKCVLSINEIINGIKLATRIITPTKRLKWPTKLNPSKVDVVIFPRTINTGIKNGIVIKRPRIDPFLRLRAFPREKKLIKMTCFCLFEKIFNLFSKFQKSELSNFFQTPNDPSELFLTSCDAIILNSCLKVVF